MHLWTREASRRGRLALAGVFVAGIGGLIVGLAAVATADSTWTITYRQIDSDPCSSAPDLTSLTVGTGTTILLVNRTGVRVTVDSGAKKTVYLNNGEEVSVRLSSGQHDVRLVPDCQVTGTVIGALVYVEKNPATQGPGGEPTVEPSPTAPSPSVEPLGPPESTPAPALAGVEPPGTGTGSLASPSPPATTSPDAIGPPELGGGPVPDQYGPTLQLTDENDHKGVQLVGVVALICILGVSVGIIRVIRAQRARSALERLT